MQSDFDEINLEHWRGEGQPVSSTPRYQLPNRSERHATPNWIERITSGTVRKFMEKWRVRIFYKFITLQLIFFKYKKSPSENVAKFYGRLRLMCSVLRASKYDVLKLIENVILLVYYTIPFGFSFFRHF